MAEASDGGILSTLTGRLKPGKRLDEAKISIRKWSDSLESELSKAKPEDISSSKTEKYLRKLRDCLGTVWARDLCLKVAGVGLFAQAVLRCDDTSRLLALECLGFLLGANETQGFQIAGISDFMDKRGHQTAGGSNAAQIASETALKLCNEYNFFFDELYALCTTSVDSPLTLKAATECLSGISVALFWSSGIHFHDKTDSVTKGSTIDAKAPAVKAMANIALTVLQLCVERLPPDDSTVDNVQWNGIVAGCYAILTCILIAADSRDLLLVHSLDTLRPVRQFHGDSRPERVSPLVLYSCKLIQMLSATNCRAWIAKFLYHLTLPSIKPDGRGGGQQDGLSEAIQLAKQVFYADGAPVFLRLLIDTSNSHTYLQYYTAATIANCASLSIEFRIGFVRLQGIVPLYDVMEANILEVDETLSEEKQSHSEALDKLIYIVCSSYDRRIQYQAGRCLAACCGSNDFCVIQHDPDIHGGSMKLHRFDLSEVPFSSYGILTCILASKDANGILALLHLMRLGFPEMLSFSLKAILTLCSLALLQKNGASEDLPSIWDFKEGVKEVAPRESDFVSYFQNAVRLGLGDALTSVLKQKPEDYHFPAVAIVLYLYELRAAQDHYSEVGEALTGFLHRLMSKQSRKAVSEPRSKAAVLALHCLYHFSDLSRKVKEKLIKVGCVGAVAQFPSYEIVTEIVSVDPAVEIKNLSKSTLLSHEEGIDIFSFYLCQSRRVSIIRNLTDFRYLESEIRQPVHEGIYSIRARFRTVNYSAAIRNDRVLSGVGTTAQAVPIPVRDLNILLKSAALKELFTIVYNDPPLPQVMLDCLQCVYNISQLYKYMPSVDRVHLLEDLADSGVVGICTYAISNQPEAYLGSLDLESPVRVTIKQLKKTTMRVMVELATLPFALKHFATELTPNVVGLAEQVVTLPAIASCNVLDEPSSLAFELLCSILCSLDVLKSCQEPLKNNGVIPVITHFLDQFFPSPGALRLELPPILDRIGHPLVIPALAALASVAADPALIHVLADIEGLPLLIYTIADTIEEAMKKMERTIQDVHPKLSMDVVKILVEHLMELIYQLLRSSYGVHFFRGVRLATLIEMLRARGNSLHSSTITSAAMKANEILANERVENLITSSDVSDDGRDDEEFRSSANTPESSKGRQVSITPTSQGRVDDSKVMLSPLSFDASPLPTGTTEAKAFAPMPEGAEGVPPMKPSALYDATPEVVPGFQATAVPSLTEAPAKQSSPAAMHDLPPANTVRPVRMKCSLNGVMRLFFVNDHTTFDELRELLYKEYGAQITQQTGAEYRTSQELWDAISLEYQDPDDDRINVTTEGDWQSALEEVKRSKITVLRTFLTVKEVSSVGKLGRTLASPVVRGSILEGLQRAEEEALGRSASGSSEEESGVFSTEQLLKSLYAMHSNAEMRPMSIDLKVAVKNAMEIKDGVPRLKWKLGDKLGEGTYGTVYKVLLPSGFMLAVKRIKFASRDYKDGVAFKEEMEALEREVNVMSQLPEHPHIVKYIGTEKSENGIDIFLEYVTGGSIASMLQSFKSFEEYNIALFTRQILQGLVFLHKHNIVHRDVKGANILVHASNGVVKLADFNSSTRIQSLAMVSGSIKDMKLMSLKGTPSYMAPEVVRQSGYGKQADIWSLGCTVVEMLTGSPPWAAEFSNHFTLMYHVASNSAPPPLPDNVPCSLELRDFLDKCFTADAHKRPSAQELLDHPFVKGIKDLRVKSPPSGQWNSRGVQNLVHERTASELSVDSAGSHNSDGRPKSWSSGRGNDF